jgi:SulP family sulfate permease
LSVAASGISIGVLVTIVVLRSVNKNVPGAMIAVVAGIALAWVFHLQDHGVAVLGSIPTGLPKIGMPRIALSWPLIEKLFPTAFAMFVVILTQSAATARAYAERSNESFNENADLVGLGLANIGAGLSGTFVVNGSPTKTQIVDSAGGSSQLAQITACAIVLLALLFLTGPLAFLPKAVLSTVVFLIGVELIDVKGMKKIFKERPFEFWVALTTATSVVIVGVEQGILLAIVLSLIVHTRHGYLVKNLLLVSSPEGWRQKNVETGQQAAPGLMIYRFLHNMYYANTHVLLQDITGLIARSQPPVDPALHRHGGGERRGLHGGRGASRAA